MLAVVLGAVAVCLLAAGTPRQARHLFPRGDRHVLRRGLRWCGLLCVAAGLAACGGDARRVIAFVLLGGMEVVLTAAVLSFWQRKSCSFSEEKEPKRLLLLRAALGRAATASRLEPAED